MSQLEQRCSCKKKRCTCWDEANMRAALQIGLDLEKARKSSGQRCNISLGVVARIWGVPNGTLRYRVGTGDYGNYKHQCKSSGRRKETVVEKRVLRQWDEDNMREALCRALNQQKAEYKGDRVSVRQLSKDWNVPLTTLQKRVLSGDANNYRHVRYKRYQNVYLRDVEGGDMIGMCM